jgi:hypothetical protein
MKYDAFQVYFMPRCGRNIPFLLAKSAHKVWVKTLNRVEPLSSFGMHQLRMQTGQEVKNGSAEKEHLIHYV